MMQSCSWGLSDRTARTDTWLLAIGCVAVAFGIQLVLGSITADAPLLLFFGAIIISAWLGGFRAGVAATLLAAAIADIDMRTLQWNGDLSFPWALRLLLFIGEGVFISAAAQGMLTPGHIALALVILALASVGTIYLWRQTDGEAQPAKAKRERMDNLLRDLSAEELLDLRQRLTDGDLSEATAADYLGDDGELVQRR